MLQELFVIAIFIAAVAFLIRMVVKNFQSKDVCQSGCGKCGALDLSKIEAQMKKKERLLSPDLRPFRTVFTNIYLIAALNQR